MLNSPRVAFVHIIYSSIHIINCGSLGASSCKPSDRVTVKSRNVTSADGHEIQIATKACSADVIKVARDLEKRQVINVDVDGMLLIIVQRRLLINENHRLSLYMCNWRRRRPIGSRLPGNHKLPSDKLCWRRYVSLLGYFMHLSVTNIAIQIVNHHSQSLLASQRCSLLVHVNGRGSIPSHPLDLHWDMISWIW